MTINLRIILWLVLAMALAVNYEAWLRDYPPISAPPHAPAAQQPTTPPSSSSSLGTQAPTAPAPSAARPGAPATPAHAPLPQKALAAVPRGSAVTIRTDVLDLKVGLVGGQLSYAALPAYPVAKDKPNVPVVLLNHSSATKLYVLQSGLAGTTGETAPTHLAMYSSPVGSLRLEPGQKQASLPLSWSNGQGVTVTKTFTFRRGSYSIGLDYVVHNGSSRPWNFAPYAQILRYNKPVAHSYFNPNSYAFKGPSIYNGRKFEKFDVQKHPTLDQSVIGGWLAALQSDFVSAIVPPPSQPYRFTLSTRGDEYLLKAIGPTQTVAPGKSAQVHQDLFVGPKLQSQLDTISPKLDLVTDYGYLTVIARPLFWLLQRVHEVIGNWGFTIIIVTILLKLLFYPLLEISGRSMAKMKVLQPRMQNLRETYKDDKEKLNRAMMELYQREKVNPLAGCLPMLIQIPVFLAFYYVLRDSVELRQAPFLFWINDLSVRDPYFVLPAIMAAANFLQFKINPQVGTDPTQQKIMTMMPLAISVTFAFFPAGLVLYWLTSTVFGILQQWHINRRIEAAAARSRR